jgi:hypothetical protein
MENQQGQARSRRRRRRGIFQWVRDNQKTVFVAMTVICMGAFVVGPALQEFLDSTGGIEGRTELVKWDGGRMTKSQLDKMSSASSQVRTFLNSLVQRTTAKNGRPSDPFHILSRQPPSFRELVETRLLAELAEEHGIEVSEEVIRDYLTTVTDHRLTNDEVRTAMKESVDTGFSQQELFDHLRIEILADRMRGFIAGQFSGIPTPADAWKHHNRINRRIIAEMLPIPAEQFVETVGSPKESDLQSFYEEYKDNLHDKRSPIPGYVTPHKMTFQFAKVSLDDFQNEEIERLKPDVTDKEIQEYYDTNHENYKKPPSLDDIDEEAGTDDQPEGDDPDADEKPAEEAPEGDDPDADEKPAEEAPEGDDPDADEKPAEEAPEGDDPDADEKPAEEAPEGDGEPEGEDGAEDGDATVPAEEEPVVEYYTLEEKREEIIEAVARSKAADTARKNMFDTIDAFEEAMRDYELRYDPRKLEGAQAGADANDNSLTAIEMRSQADLSRLFEEQGKPKHLQIGTTGEISFDEMDLVIQAMTEMKEEPEEGSEPAWHELARSVVFDFTGGQFRQDYVFRRLAFSGTEIFQVESLSLPAPQFANTIFLYWRTDVVDPKQQSLDDIRQQVRDDWVRLKSAEQLEKRATELATLADAKGAVPLAETLAEEADCDVEQIFETMPFSFLTGGMTPMGGGGGNQFNLGSIMSTEGVPVKYVTGEFMQKIFERPVGGVAAVIDSQRQTAYLVRVSSDVVPENIRRENFVYGNQQGIDPSLMQLTQQDQMGQYQRWLQQLHIDKGVEWAVNPDQ